jgi:hypothetical protein
VEVPRPTAPPARGHISVAVVAAGIQASDIIQMSGGYGALSRQNPASIATGDVQPGDLGCEGVGIIVGIGSGLDTAAWFVGQTVAWWGSGVSFREWVEVPVTSVIQVPSADPLWTALPVSAMTAVGGLELVGRIKPSAKVLVTGAAGGTGHIAVQWAKLCGARVAGTCGSAVKAAMLESLGVDVVVNYRTQDVASALRESFPEGFDIVYECVGGRVGDDARKLLNPTGIVVGIGSVSEDYSGKVGPDTHNSRVAHAVPSLTAGQRSTFFFMPNGPSLAGQARWDELVAKTVDAIASGKIQVVLDEACLDYTGLEGVYQAQARMRTGLNVGKIYARIGGVHALQQN